MSEHNTTSQSGGIYAPDAHECESCGKSTQLAGQAHIRAICRTRGGDIREYAASEVMAWDATGAINMKSSSMEFVKWEVLCAGCKFDPNRTTAQQKADLSEQMDTNGITPKATQKAYRIIQQLLAPALMGSCKANADQKKYAAKVVLWHWPQASNDAMPDDIKTLCNELVAT